MVTAHSQDRDSARAPSLVRRTITLRARLSICAQEHFPVRKTVELRAGTSRCAQGCNPCAGS